MLANADAEIGGGPQRFGEGGFRHHVPAFGGVHVGILDQAAAIDLPGQFAGPGRGERAVEGNQPEILGLGFQEFEGVRLEGRGDERLDEAALEHLGRGEIDGAGDGDDGAERRDDVALPGGGEGGGEGGAGGGAAGIGVLDDDGGGGGMQFARGFEGRVAVHVVVVGHFLAVEDAGGGEAGLRGERGVRPEDGGLVGILAVAQRNFRGAAGEPGGDGGVIGGDAGEGLVREGLALGGRQVAAGAQGGQHRGVVGRIAQGDHVRAVLGRGAEHGGPADIDVLDGRGLLERVEVDAHQIDGRKAQIFAGFHIRGNVPALEDAAVDLGVEGLDAAVENFGLAGEDGDVDDGQAGGAQGGGGAAGGEQFDAQRRQAPDEIDQAGLVGNAQQGALDLHAGRLFHRPVQMGRAFGGETALGRGFNQFHEAFRQRRVWAGGPEPGGIFKNQLPLPESSQMAEDGIEGNVEGRRNTGDVGGAIQQLAENADPTGMGQRESGADNRFIPGRIRLGKDGLQGLVQGAGAGHLRVGPGEIADERALALDAQQAAGLETPQFLAGPGKADSRLCCQPGNRQAGGGQNEPEQAQAGGSGQHPASSPKRGIQVH